MSLSSDELLAMRNELWERVRHIPGVRNIAVRANADAPSGVEFVLHVDSKELKSAVLPHQQGEIPVTCRDDLPGIAH
ncbi:MAG: hypothetical protein MI861_17465 [Pirellulales bacterium]|nr:hypothetical protein [Pirellulales bacterium]